MQAVSVMSRVGVKIAVLILIVASHAISAFADQAKAIMVKEGQFVLAPIPTAARGMAASRGASAEDRKALFLTLNVRSGMAASVHADADGFVPLTQSAIKACKDYLLENKLAEEYVCEPDYKIEASLNSNDPRAGELWGMQKINARGAWDMSTGGSNVVVAVLDSGVDYNHPDLTNNMWRNPGETAGNNVDDDGNGYVDDIYGIDTANDDTNPLDDNGHGTHVSGTIGATGNNAQGVVGVNWSVKIMALKFLTSGGSGNLSAAIKAIDYMVDMKQRGVNIKVSNNSWGGEGYSQALFDAVSRARDAGIVFAVAAGNKAYNNDVTPAYPASYDLDNVVSVAATDRDDNLASFSNYGSTSVHIAAPGVSILSTLPNGDYGTLSGTSMATPHVAGALALLLAHDSGLTYRQAIDRLYYTGTDLASLSGVIMTGRSLNAQRLLANNGSAIPAPPQESCSYSVETGTYTPDEAVLNQQIVIQNDELNFKEVPFNFNYFGRSFSSIFLSPNGLFYAVAPSGMDYQDIRRAFTGGVHMDMNYVSPNQGVRYRVDGDKLHIAWRGAHYANTSAGDFTTRMTIYADGTIGMALDVSNASVEGLVGNSAHVGITGTAVTNTITYAYKDPSKVHQGMSVKFVPSCQPSTPPSNPLKLSSLVVNGKNGKKLTPQLYRGKEWQALLTVENSSNSSTAIVTAEFDGRACSNTFVVSLSSNTQTIGGRFPKTDARKFSLVVTSGSEVIKQAQKINARRNTGVSRNAQNSRRKLSTRQHEQACQGLFATVNQN